MRRKVSAIGAGLAREVFLPDQRGREQNFQHQRWDEVGHNSNAVNRKEPRPAANAVHWPPQNEYK